MRLAPLANGIMVALALTSISACSKSDDSIAAAETNRGKESVSPLIGTWRRHIQWDSSAPGSSTWNGQCLLFTIGPSCGTCRLLSCPKPGIGPAIAYFVIAQE